MATTINNAICRAGATHLISSLRGPVTRLSIQTSPVTPAFRTTHAGLTFRSNFSRLSRSTPAPQIAQALKDDGCVVIKSLCTAEQVTRLNADMDNALRALQPGRPAGSVPGVLPDDAGMQGMLYGKNTKRLGNMINHSPTWRDDVIDSDVMHAVCDEALKGSGEYWLSTAQMIEIGPGSKPQPLHADGGQWWPFFNLATEGMPEYTLNFLIATTDTTKENGATGVVRGSHKVDYAGMDDQAKLHAWRTDQEVEQIELKVGDCLVLGGRILHRGEENKTQNQFRRVLSCTVVNSAFTPEEAHPLYIEDHVARGFPARVRKFLAFESMRPLSGLGVWMQGLK